MRELQLGPAGPGRGGLASPLFGRGVRAGAERHLLDMACFFGARVLLRVRVIELREQRGFLVLRRDEASGVRVEAGAIRRLPLARRR
jgi:hypothetical protein